jgi:hypothetical protein
MMVRASKDRDDEGGEPRAGGQARGTGAKKKRPRLLGAGWFQSRYCEPACYFFFFAAAFFFGAAFFLVANFID